MNMLFYGFIFAAFAASTATAAELRYPTKPVRLISAYAPGGGNDTVARGRAAPH